MAEYVPRTNADGMYNSKFWYSDNPFFQSGYGLPNCTCYAWGRAYEISGIRPQLPLYDASDWYNSVDTRIYQKGTTPKVGAIACWNEPKDPTSPGHVAVVEYVKGTTIYVSESRYRRPIAPYPPDTEHYFDYTKMNNLTKRLSWMASTFKFQGYIYNPFDPVPPTPQGFPIWLLFKLKERRDKNETALLL